MCSVTMLEIQYEHVHFPEKSNVKIVKLGTKVDIGLYLSALWSHRAANNFPAGAGQIVRSNLFLLGHIPFLAGQTSITSYRYKSTPSPLHMMFKYETSKFSKHLLYMSIDLNAGKVERMVQQNQYHICAYYYCLSSTSYIRLVMKLMKLTEACNLVDFKCCQKQGSSFPKMRDWTFKIQ